MPRKESSDSDWDEQSSLKPDSAADESADRAEGEEAPVKLPASPRIPPPPEIEFKRPVLGAKRASSSAAAGSHIGSRRRFDTGANAAATYGASVGAGVTFAASIVVGFAIGQWVDHRFGHGGVPWGTIVFGLAGLVAGFINLFRLLTTAHGGSDKKNK